MGNRSNSVKVIQEVNHSLSVIPRVPARVLLLMYI